MSQRVSCPSCEKKYAGVVGGENDGGGLPVILPCLCVFCKACALAEEAKAQRQEAKQGGEKGGGRQKKKRKVEIKKKEYTPTPCMKCQKPSSVPVADLKLDAALMRLIASNTGGGGDGGGGSAKRKKAPRCDVCEEEDATKYCNGCSKIKLFCDSCFAHAHRSAKKKSHATIPIEEHLASGPAAPAAGGGGGGGGGAAKEPPATMCSIHPDEALKHFCNDCNILVCGSCAVQHHNGHSLTTTGDAVGVHRTAIETLMAQVVVSRTHAIAAANAIKSVRGELEGNRDAAFKLVDADFNKKRVLLNTLLQTNRQQRDALKALIKGAHDEKYDVLSAQIDALDDIESNSELALALVTATLATTSPVELMERKQTFVDGLMQFKEHKVALRRCRISKIDVVLDTSFAEKVADILKMGRLDTERAPQPELQKQLCAAVKKGEADMVRKLLAEDDADPAVPGGDDLTAPPIYLAGQSGHVEVVRVLLEHHVNPNQATIDAHGETAVFVAAQNGHVDVVTALVAGNADVNKARTDNGETPVYIAAQKGHVDVVTALVAGNADVNQATTDDGFTPVYIAAEEGHVDVVTALVAGNADVNQAETTDIGATPVYVAAEEGHVDVVKLLVASNADVNQATTTDGSTPVYIAAQEGHVDVVKVLLASNADPNQAETEDDWTPLMMATQEGHTAVVALLKQHGAV
eukprot:gene22067-biopygen25406